jgi:chemotaxis protein MotB
MVLRNNKPTLILPEPLLFDVGEYSIDDRGKTVLRRFASAIRSFPSLRQRSIQISGHTDNTPVRPGFKYKDNWELSTLRAQSVFHFLVAESGGNLPSAIFSIAGFGDADPISTGDSSDNRAKNRRVELVVQPDLELIWNFDKP